METDLLATIEQDTPLRRTSSHRGGEYHGPCPFCGGTDRFRVQPEHGFWKCRQCGRGGDLVAYLVATGRLSLAEAYRERHGDAKTTVEHRGRQSVSHVKTPGTPAGEVVTAPNRAWQGRAWNFVADCQDELWGPDGERALEWLRGRGLHDDTIRGAGLGYNPQDSYEERAVWGLPTNSKRIWLPRGIVIPWFVAREIWRVNIRRPIRPGQRPKFIGPAGFANGLYNADQLSGERPAIIVEGELDALTLLQEAGDIVVPVATGSAEGARRSRWVAELALCSQVLVSFDADEAGEPARRYWREVLPNSRYWRPYWGDANAMLQDGVDVKAWVSYGLGEQPSGSSGGIPMVIPADRALVPGLALPAGAWERLADGSIRVVFPNRETLQTCVEATRAIRASMSTIGQEVGDAVPADA